MFILQERTIVHQQDYLSMLGDNNESINTDLYTYCKKASSVMAFNPIELPKKVMLLEKYMGCPFSHFG